MGNSRFPTPSHWHVVGEMCYNCKTMFSLTRRRRRILFWLFVVFFILVTPLIIGFSQGYRFDFARLSIAQVGAIALDSTPDSARILIDGEYVGHQTPELIRNLLPFHTYRVTVARDTYLPWEKELEVLPRKVAAARGIILFPQDLSLESLPRQSPPLGTLHSSGRSARALSLSASSVPIMVDFPSGATSTATFTDGLASRRVADVAWSDDGRIVAFRRETVLGSSWFVWDGNAPPANVSAELRRLTATTTAQIQATGRVIEQVDFAGNNRDRLLVRVGEELWYVDRAAGEGTILEPDSVSLFLAQDGRLFVVSIGEANILEIEYDGDIVRSYGTLRFPPTELLLAPDGRKLLIHNESSADVVWLEDVFGDYEKKRGDQSGLLATQKPIVKIFWHYSSAYVLSVLEGGALSVIELDERGTRNTYAWDLGGMRDVSYLLSAHTLLTLDPRGALLQYPEEF